MFKIIKKSLFTLLCILFSFHGFAADVLKGDQELVGASFSFPIQAHTSSQFGRNVYVGAHPNQTGLGNANNFALAAISRGNSEFAQLAPKEVKLNGQEKQDNPMFDTGIQLLSLIDQAVDQSEHPVAVLGNDLSTVYLLERLSDPKNISLLRVQNIPDAAGNTTAGIVQLETGTRGHIFAAVKTNDGSDFGTGDSGVALLLFGRFGETSVNALAVVGNAVPLNKSSSQLKIGADLAQIKNNAVAMHLDPQLGFLYVGLQVQAAGGGGDGARAIVVGQVGEGNQLVFNPIVANDNALTGVNKIVGANVGDANVSVHEVKSMFTSTALSYLIVRGGNGDVNPTRNKVFALPLVSGNQDNTLNGTIANKNADPEDVFSENTNVFIARVIKEPATAAADMPTATDVAVVVGGGELTVGGDITEFFVQGDSVFAQVDGDGGVFYSQALFDAKGKIKGWTNWRRFLGVTEKVFGASLDRQTAELMFLTGADVDNVTTVKRTKWSQGSEQGTLKLNNVINSLDGVCGLFDFNPETPALDDISVLIATGLDGIVLGETGQVVGGVLVPNQGADFDNVQKFDNGTITQNLGAGGNPKVVVIQGGALEEVGPLTAAEIARDGAGDNGWLFCGGCNGVAILSKVDGSGWDLTANELGAGFDGLTNDMSFKKIGDYSFVRKLVSDGNFLYVLTDTRLDRIDLTQGNPGLDNLSVTTLATNVQLTGNADVSALQDLIVSGKFALLATSNGLFRVGNGNDIRAAADSKAVDWTRVATPESMGPVTNLFAVSKTGRAQDVAAMGGGQIYALVADRSINRAHVNRFAIADVSATAIDSSTVTPFPDIFVKGITSYFVNLSEFRDLFVTDGANNFHTRAKELERQANLKLLPASFETSIASGFRFLGARSVTVPISMEESVAIATMVQNAATGSWTIGNDRGVQVDE